MRRMAASESSPGCLAMISWAVTRSPRSQAPTIAATSREIQPPSTCSLVFVMPAPSAILVRREDRPAFCDREATRQVVEDAAHAPLVQARARGDLAHLVAVHPQPDDLVMRGR